MNFSILFSNLLNIDTILRCTLDSGYDLYVIEDDLVPLAGGIAGAESNYYIPTVIVIILIVLAIFIGFWFIRRSRLVKRLKELRAKTGRQNEKIPFTHKAIREEIRQLEAELVAPMFN